MFLLALGRLVVAGLGLLGRGLSVSLSAGKARRVLGIGAVRGA